jgi:hypothetical protein
MAHPVLQTVHSLFVYKIQFGSTPYVGTMQNLPERTVPYEHVWQALTVELKTRQFWSTIVQEKGGDVPAGLGKRINPFSQLMQDGLEAPEYFVQ